MASFRGLFSDRRKVRHRDEPYPDVVHLYFLSYHGLSSYYLYGPCFLDEHKKLHEGGQTKPVVLFVGLNEFNLQPGIARLRARRCLHKPAK